LRSTRRLVLANTRLVPPSPSLIQRCLGHAWTIGPNLRHRVLPHRAPPSRTWSTILQDADLGPVRLTGQLREEPGSDTLLLVTHGLGGEPERSYCIQAAHAAERAGVSCLRLALRGADRLGEDYYHAGLTDDVAAALSSPEGSRYRRVLLLGYSMGGHTLLLAAVRRVDPRIAAVTAICAPLDLRAGQEAIDRPARILYRRHVLEGLNEIYRAVALRREVPTPVERVERARTIRERDALTICPRFGFRDPDDYYRQAGVGHRLDRLELPALLVASASDPMVPPETLLRSLHRAAPALTVRWIAGGGHVFFPEGTDLGLGGGGGVEDQALCWMLRSA
jgi:predicted alpha/beta-fold hydrolase